MRSCRRRAYPRGVTVPTSVRPTPSLRIEEMGVQGYRTFKERVIVPFRAGRRPAEAISALHGASNTGKTNLLSAIVAFFRGVDLCLTSPTCAVDIAPGADPASCPVSFRDRFRIEGPTELDVRFADTRLVPLRLSVTPFGDNLRYSLKYLPPNDMPAPGHALPAEKLRPIPEDLRGWLGAWIREPMGPGSRPIARLCARDSASAVDLGLPRGPYPLPPLGEELYRRRTSLDPAERDLWHRFVLAARGLPQFENKDISVERIDGHPAEIVIEDRGRSVLRFSELSANEQQALTLGAFSFLSLSALLVIEYPETHLDDPMKTALLTLLQRRVDSGRIDQVFLETHETRFDGPTVLRVFKREGGWSDVVRGPSAGEAPPEIDRKGREQGAKQGWVTREGYTQLPEPMREELHLTLGGHVWFLKGKTRWEAWPGQDLERLFPQEDSEERDQSDPDE